MPAAKKLKTHVHVHQEDGSVVVYGPGDTIPKADADKIGDHCWEKPEASSDASGS